MQKINPKQWFLLERNERAKNCDAHFLNYSMNYYYDDKNNRIHSKSDP